MERGGEGYMLLPRKHYKEGLYDSQFEKDNCGIGFLADIKGKKSHDIVEKGLQPNTSLFCIPTKRNNG